MTAARASLLQKQNKLLEKVNAGKIVQFAETYTLSGKQIEKVFGLFNISARSAKSTHIW